MAKLQKKNIQISFIIFLIIGAAFASNFIFVVGQTGVECADDSACPRGYACQKLGDPANWKCVETRGESTNSNYQNNQGVNNYQSSTDYTSIIIAVIFGVAIIIGLIILAIILSRRKKR